MADEVANRLTYIPETILKKRKVNEEVALRRKEQLEQRKFAKSKKSKNEFIKKPEDFVKEFRYREADFLRLKTRMKRKRPELTSTKSKLLFIIRIQGKNDMHPVVRKTLYDLRLRKIFNGVFVKVNTSVLEKLRKVEPYVTYGYPNLKNVKELIFKKGFANIDKQRVPLTDNNIIEQALGKFGILCIDDMVHEVATVGPHFKEIIRFLWPFTLNKPIKELKGSKALFKDGGETGNREDLINELIDQMN